MTFGIVGWLLCRNTLSASSVVEGMLATATKSGAVVVWALAPLVSMAWQVLHQASASLRPAWALSAAGGTPPALCILISNMAPSASRIAAPTWSQELRCRFGRLIAGLR